MHGCPDRTPQVLAGELVTTMLGSGAVVLRDGRLHAGADQAPVPAAALRVPYSRDWPPA
ncbi:hypothetical protein JK364_46040 [Streptomyces sp. 110]|uniref:Amidohydrolase n=1 Tax=Streptomyces endocoffeicus TaxID=2898945 RepID=A0ABS1Q4Q7_9ACTN|nr:hypothetical protein [Streptomyces endocoffeicus]MBL1119638.1 hypothetical protein [Streptomyces endocoffeicus]